MDVVEFVNSPVVGLRVGGCEVSVSRLGLIDWFALNGIKQTMLNALRDGGWWDALLHLEAFFTKAAKVSASTLLLSEALAALPALWAFNELRYIDPAIGRMAQERTEPVYEEELENAWLADLISTLAQRFSLEEIRELQPELAFLCWQRIIEDRAETHTVIFYSTELGYDKKYTDQKKGSYRLQPRQSPYLPPWRAARRRGRQRVEPPDDYRSPFIKHPEKVIDPKNIEKATEGRSVVI